MSSTLLSYQLPTFTGLMSNGWSQPALFRDGDDIIESKITQEIDAQVRSGDYFVTLATRLDELSRDATDYSVRFSLEEIVSDLIYLQDNYTITKDKTSE